MIYYITGGEMVKIGTTTNIQRRFAAISACSPVPLVLAALTEGDRRVEQELHRRFSSLRRHGEWFSLSDELRAHIDSIQERPTERRLDEGRAAAYSAMAARMQPGAWYTSSWLTHGRWPKALDAAATLRRMSEVGMVEQRRDDVGCEWRLVRDRKRPDDARR